MIDINIFLQKTLEIVVWWVEIGAVWRPYCGAGSRLVGVTLTIIIYYVLLIFYFDALHGLISRGRVRHYPCAGWKGLISSGRMSLPVRRATRFEHSVTVDLRV